MAGREAPVRAHLPKQSPSEHGTRSAQPRAQSGRCLGATAQLAAVHQIVKGRLVPPLRASGVRPQDRDTNILERASATAKPIALTGGAKSIARGSPVVQRVPGLQPEMRVRVNTDNRARTGTIKYVYNDGNYLVKPTQPADDVVLAKYPEPSVDLLPPIDQELVYELDRPPRGPVPPAGSPAGSGSVARAPVDPELVEEPRGPPKDFDQVQTVAEAVMAQYPPDQYHYIGLGKSPTPIIAFVQAYGETADMDISASNLPLSKFSHKIDRMSPAEEADAGPALDREQNVRLQAHFERFVPLASDLKGKKFCSLTLCNPADRWSRRNGISNTISRRNTARPCTHFCAHP